MSNGVGKVSTKSPGSGSTMRPRLQGHSPFWDLTDPVNLTMIFLPLRMRTLYLKACVNPGLTIWVQTSILVQFIWYWSFNLLDCVCWPVFMFVFLPSIAGLCGPIFARNGVSRIFLPNDLQWAKQCQNVHQNKVSRWFHTCAVPTMTAK